MHITVASGTAKMKSVFVRIVLPKRKELEHRDGATVVGIWKEEKSFASEHRAEKKGAGMPLWCGMLQEKFLRK